MNTKSKTIDRCQISKKKDLKKIISLGYLPPVNNYIRINSIRNEETFFPTELMFSKRETIVDTLLDVINEE